MKPLTSSAVALPLLFASLTSALTTNCGHIRIGGKKFNLLKLDGPHSVFTHDEAHPPAMHNTTWTVDICKPLKKDKNLPSANQCPAGTYVCGITTTYNPTLDPVVPEIDQVIPIAGNYEGAGSSGRSLDPHYDRLKESDANSDGLRMTLKGGSYAKRDQRAIIEFQCDEERSGNEGFEEKKRRRDDKKGEDDGEEEGDKKSLTFVSYGKVDDKTDVLRLNWRTKYACEDYADRDDEDDEGGKKGGWGFFTWFILMYVFSCPHATAANKTSELSWQQQPTSSLALGSITTATARAAGIYSRTATRSATSPTYSRTGREKSSTRYPAAAWAEEEATALSSTTAKL